LRLSRSSAADELEVKARVDDPEALRRVLGWAGAVSEFRGAMVDRRFDRKGRLERRDEVLRLRIYRPADGSPAYGVLGWKGPHSKRGKYRHRGGSEARIAGPGAAAALGRGLGPRGRAGPWVPLDDIREELATRVLELGGEARAAAVREERERVLEAVSRRAWLGAWERAVRRAAERVARALD